MLKRNLIKCIIRKKEQTTLIFFLQPQTPVIKYDLICTLSKKSNNMSNTGFEPVASKATTYQNCIRQKF